VTVCVGAVSSASKLCMLVGKTVSDDDRRRGRYDQHSVILIPVSTAGVRVLRPLNVFGFDDAPRQSLAHHVVSHDLIYLSVA